VESKNQFTVRENNIKLSWLAFRGLALTIIWGGGGGAFSKLLVSFSESNSTPSIKKNPQSTQEDRCQVFIPPCSALRVGIRTSSMKSSADVSFPS
jgi:hypothetical protein